MATPPAKAAVPLISGLQRRSVSAALDLAPSASADYLVRDIPAACDDRHDNEGGDQGEQGVPDEVKREKADDPADHDRGELEQTQDRAPFCLGNIDNSHVEGRSDRRPAVSGKTQGKP